MNATYSTRQPLLKQHKAIIFKSRKSKNGQKIRKSRMLRCVLVGDGAVGKTSLAMSYSRSSFPTEYIPTAFDNYSVTVEVDGKAYNINLCDTAGQNELNSLRGLCYSEADVFMLCFSVVQPETFKSACTRWLIELTNLNVPIVLVGTQSDLRSNSSVVTNLLHKGQRPVTFAEARQLSERICAPYIETSALNNMHLKEAFDHAILAAMRHKADRCVPIWKRLCCIK